VFDAELLTTSAVLLAVMMGGAVAVWLTFRWYRNLKQSLSAPDDALAQLTRALEDEEAEFDPEDVARIRAAIERQKQRADQPGTVENKLEGKPPGE
jgi:hypothetical protein